MNNKPKSCRSQVQNANMGCIRHHRNEPLTSDIKSLCLSSLTISQHAINPLTTAMLAVVYK